MAWPPAAATAVLLGATLLVGYGMVHPKHASTTFVVPSPSATPISLPTASPSPSPAAQVSTDPSAEVRAAVAQYLNAQGIHAAVAVLDRVTGATVTYNETVSFDTASIVKVDILATLLWQDQRAGRHLTAAQRDLAEDMITESDNDAATALWNTIGGATGLASANKAFGLSHTTPGRDGYWGLTTTTVADQVRLLQVLTDPAGPLSVTDQSYELGLMGRVTSDQRWGVPHAADADATAVYVKNGWLAYSGDRGRWIVNSVGRVVEPGHDWLITVLSDHHGSQSTGIAIVEHLATLVVTGLTR